MKDTDRLDDEMPFLYVYIFLIYFEIRINTYIQIGRERKRRPLYQWFYMAGLSDKVFHIPVALLWCRNASLHKISLQAEAEQDVLYFTVLMALSVPVLGFVVRPVKLKTAAYGKL